MSTPTYIQEVKEILAAARQRAYKQMNVAMIEAYWHIGKRIMQEEQGGEKRAGYGEELLQQLSRALTKEFGKNFSYTNLRNFRQFYLTYPDENICYTLCSKLAWSHNRLIKRLENQEERKYYLQEAASQNWSVRELERNINALYFQRLLSNRNREKIITTPHNKKQITKDFIKYPYVFEFLNIAEPTQSMEREIETVLITNLQSFLLELDKGFSFVGRQFRISTETSHFYIDLIFYNYILKCFVQFDLKVTKLTHQDIGQMDMYDCLTT